MERDVSRPFRVAPPEVGDALLRPALLALLLERFEARVMVVRAGGGFGKTTALSQAVQQNRLAARGHDVWLGLEPDDVDGSHLVQGLAEALDLPDNTVLAGVLDAVAAASPTQVAVILDDVHELPAGSSGAEVVAALVADLPANGHIVLVTRTEPHVNLARLQAQGRVRRIGESDLVLGPDQIATLAERAGRTGADVEHLGGWPALVALGLQSGPIEGFLDQEILSSLDDDQCQLLALVVALGGADAELLRTLTGIDPAAALGELPMMHRASGWFQAHGLWGEVFPVAEIEAQQQQFLHPAVEELLGRGNLVRAVDLACRGDDADLLLRALHKTVIAGDVEDLDALKRWRARLPSALSRHPVVHHIDGLLAQASDPTTARALDSFQRAADGFETLGDLDAVVSAYAEIGFWHHVQRDAGGLLTVAIKMQELATAGATAAAPYVDITQAFLALSQGDPHAMLGSLRRARSARMTGRFRAVADWLEYQAQEFLGVSDVDLADRYLAGAGAIRGTEVLGISARWRAGHIEELLATTEAWEPQSGSDRARFLNQAWLTVVAAGCGRVADARDHLARAKRYAGEGGAAQVEITLLLPEALIEYEAGNEERSRQIFVDLLHRIPLSNSTRLSYNGSGALIVRVIDDLDLDALAVPMPQRDTDLGFALRDMDKTGELHAIRDVAWPASTGLLVSSVFLRASCEFVCAAWAVGRPEAAAAADWLLEVVGDEARLRFRDHCAHPVPAVAAAAKEILAAVPLPPAEHRSLFVLGAERLEIDGTETTHEDWRRERVRSLLGFLVVHPDTTREIAMAALWPEASEEKARRSFRSTLNLLLGVMESTRTGGDASYFVRTDGTRIRLVGYERLTIDVWRFDELLDEADALEASGAPSLALDRQLEAIALYKGGLLDGVLDAEWLHLERQRLHIRFVAASVRAAELLLAHDRADEAINLAARAIQVEPWSEPAHCTLVAAHLQRGDRAAAHRAMRRCHELLDELGGPVDEATQMLERRLSSAS